MTIKKILRAQSIAAANRLPLVYLVDSSGVFLPMQDEVFPDEDDFGRIFRNNAVLSARGDSPVRRDHGQLRRRRGLPARALRHGADDRGLGALPRRPRPREGGHRPEHLARGARRRPRSRGHQRHDRLSRARRRLLPRPPPPADRAPASPIRRAAPDLAAVAAAGPARRRPLPRGPAPRPRPSTTCATCWPACSTAAAFDEFRAEYGKTLVCGFGRLGGMALGVVASQRLRFRPEGGGPYPVRRRDLRRQRRQGRTVRARVQPEPAADPLHPGRQRLRRGPRRRADAGSSAAGRSS